jgi:hypothetical protein
LRHPVLPQKIFYAKRSRGLFFEEVGKMSNLKIILGKKILKIQNFMTKVGISGIHAIKLSNFIFEPNLEMFLICRSLLIFPESKIPLAQL